MDQKDIAAQRDRVFQTKDLENIRRPRHNLGPFAPLAGVLVATKSCGDGLGPLSTPSVEPAGRAGKPPPSHLHHLEQRRARLEPTEGVEDVVHQPLHFVLCARRVRRKVTVRRSHKGGGVAEVLDRYIKIGDASAGL